MESCFKEKTSEQRRGILRVKNELEDKEKPLIWEGISDIGKEERPDYKRIRRIFPGHSLTGTVTRPTFAAECVGVLTNGKVAGVTNLKRCTLCTN